ncbi:MAG: epoxyqueuosine reductase QueH [Clostridia bacterium]|nr:epoxyqueuosine reductase QueH [Clostridia bacterium]
MTKQNYNLMMKQQLSNLSGKPKLLLHVCCAPCSSAVIEKLKEYFNITLYYFNPNTYPESEYIKRSKQFAKLTNLPLIVCNYNHDEFLNKIKGFEQCREGEIRCQKCIALRLEKSFEYASNNNFAYVTTTLSISPHKDCNFINACGEQLQKEYNATYLYGDFKKENGYLTSITLSKQFDLYRQDYCGCEFSMLKPN